MSDGMENYLLGRNPTLGGRVYERDSDGRSDMTRPTGLQMRGETERRAIWMIDFRRWCREGCPCPA